LNHSKNPMVLNKNENIIINNYKRNPYIEAKKILESQVLSTFDDICNKYNCEINLKIDQLENKFLNKKQNIQGMLKKLKIYNDKEKNLLKTTIKNLQNHRSKNNNSNV